MKKIIVILVLFVLTILSLFIFDNSTTKASSKISKNEVINDKKLKEDYQYITEDSDNIEELLKESQEVITKIKYTYEEKNVEEVILKNGFIEENGIIYYYENDKYVVGEKEINNDKYYFNEKGELQKNGFVNKKYFGEDGKQVLGFFNIEDNTYYFNKEGYVVGNQEIENNIYYFNENGIMQKDIIIENCYYDIDGKLYTGFKEIDGNTFCFTKEGFMKGINEVKGKKYYFDEEGHLIKNSFYDKYYLDENGVVVTGTKEISGRTYIFDDNGMIKNGFQVIDGNTYFLDEENNKLKGLQLIDNIRYYFDFETGVLIQKDVKSIIDISSWQGDIDFEQVKKSNLVDGVMVRIGYGTTTEDNPVLDNKFERNISELNRLNIPYGIYIFGYAQNENAAALEAEFVDNAIKKYNVNLSYPIFYDAELTEFEGIKYTKTLYKKVINKFISLLNEKGYKDVGVYANLYSLTNGNLSALQKRIPKWVAQYNTKCEYDGDYIGWQYTSDGNIPGINERVDMNIFYR